jgi:hypothetical protein
MPSPSLDPAAGADARPSHRIPADLEVVNVFGPQGEYLGPVKTRAKIRWLLAGDPLATMEIQRKRNGMVQRVFVYLRDLDAFLTLEREFHLGQYMPVKHSLVERRTGTAELPGAQRGDVHARRLVYYEFRAAREAVEAVRIQRAVPG